MSSDARRGRVKIIESKSPSRAQELVGGLKNAFERGESFTKAKQSFINAGYKPLEVEAAAHEMRKSISPTSQPPTSPVETEPASTIKKSRTKGLPTTPKVPIRKKGMPKFLIIALIITLILILVGAVVLGLFWDKWF